MGFYADHILPWALHLCMRADELAELRRAVLPAARGRVLELGVGSGLNLPFYDGDVEAVVGIDPSAPLLAMARKHLDRAPCAVELVAGSAEEVPYEDKSFDSVVTTWTLCTIPDAAKALAEARRLLKPGGELVFIEHGRAPDPGVARWQHRLNPLWRRIGGGCNLDRDIPGLIRGAGFDLVELETGYLVKGPRTHTYLYKGRARPA